MGDTFNIYMTGVGGQGIGLLAEVLARASDKAGLSCRGCDTHGLAQRGGMVTSHLKLGRSWSPLVGDGEADLVIALERHEALRAAKTMLRDRGTIVWYDTVWQPLAVRTGTEKEAASGDIETECLSRESTSIRVFRSGLGDPRMQNIALVAEILGRSLVPGIAAGHVKEALAELMSGPILEANLALLAAIS